MGRQPLCGAPCLPPVERLTLDTNSHDAGQRGRPVNIEPQPYLSYLLRLWLAENGGERIWRASLESPRSGQRTGFASLNDLFDFLRQEVNEWTTDLGQEEPSADGTQSRASAE